MPDPAGRRSEAPGRTWDPAREKERVALEEFPTTELHLGRLLCNQSGAKVNARPEDCVAGG